MRGPCRGARWRAVMVWQRWGWGLAVREGERRAGNVQQPASGERLQGLRPDVWRGWRRVKRAMGGAVGWHLEPRAVAVRPSPPALMRSGGGRDSPAQTKGRRHPTLAMRREMKRAETGRLPWQDAMVVVAGKSSGMGGIHLALEVVV